MANERKVGNLMVQMRAELGQLRLDVKEMERTFSTGFNGIKSAAVGLGKAFAGAFAFGSVVAFSRRVVDLAGHLQDLSDQTGISAQLLSGMKSTLEESGTSLDAFATGIFRAQKNIGLIDNEGDKAAQAVKRLGLNLDELRNAPTDRFLQLVTGALVKIENPAERAAVGAQLLGKSFQELWPGINAVAGRLDDLRNQGMSDDAIRQLDEFGDSLTRLSNIMQVMASGPLAHMARGLDHLLRDLGILEKTAAQSFATLEARVRSMTETTARTLGRETGEVLMMTNEQLEDIAKTAPTAVRVVADQLIKARQALQDLLGKSSAGSGPVNLPKSAPARFEGLGDDAARKKFESFLDGLRKQSDQLRTSLAELTGGPLAGLVTGLDQAFAAAGGDKIAGAREKFEQWKAEIVRLTQELSQAKFAADRFDEAIKRDDQDRAEWLTFTQDVVKLKDAVDAVAKAWKDMRSDQLAAMFDQDSAEWLTVPEDTAKDISRRAEEAWRPWEQISTTVFQGIQTGLLGAKLGTQSFGQAFANMGMNILASLNEMIFKMLVLEPLLKSLKAAFTGGGAGVGGLFGGLFGGSAGGFDFAALTPGLDAIGMGLAEGGIVTRPGVSKLAEVEPEAVIPLSKLSGMRSTGGNVYNIDARGAQRGVSAEIMRAINMSKKAAVKESVGAVQDERRRSSNYARSFSSRR